MKTIILNFTFLLLGATLFAQTTWTVDNRPGTTAQFTSVQAAIDAASEGDFIYIHPSPNAYPNITINKEIHLRGIGHGPELANGESAKISAMMLFTDNLSKSASNSSISGLEIINGINDNNFGAISNVLIQNNKIGSISLSRPFNYIIQGNLFNSIGTANYLNIFNINHGNNIITHNIFIRNSSSNTQINGTVSGLISSDTFNNNLMVFDNTGTEKIAFNNCNNPILNNNMFLLTSRDAISTIISTINNFNNIPLNFQNCLTFAYGGQTLTTLNGINNLNNVNPQFRDIGSPENPLFTYTKNYKLKAGSPAIGAGSDNSDLGIYGQGFLFQMKGYPFDLPYPTSININNAVVEAGGNLEVVFKANANVEN
ncbi:hypothetical protein ACFQ1R_06070 [Mariniflexile jejuense]|uniref:Parallel beta helix pectate lyase-like protein n=1 Tax=Mariniflexile jejuense TaxID=1173582 RepID=A0ABW3JGN7_9FLAO